MSLSGRPSHQVSFWIAELILSIHRHRHSMSIEEISQHLCDSDDLGEKLWDLWVRWESISREHDKKRRWRDV